MSDRGVSWNEFEQAEAVLAGRVRDRFESHRHGVLATVRADGSPRLSGLEKPIRDGHLWLAMMPGSRKAADLYRDPRFSLHSAPDAEDLLDGDARIDGTARPAAAAEQETFATGHRFHIDDLSAMALFVASIGRVVLVWVADGELLIGTWTAIRGLAVVRGL